MLAGLSGNSGTTSTFLPAEDSPAVDHVPLAQCTDLDSVALTTNQRGAIRPAGDQCDAGSVELGLDLVYEDGFEGSGP